MAKKPTLDTEAMRLGRWLHEAADTREGEPQKPFRALKPETKAAYYRVARKLLENPPLEVRRAVRKLEG